MGFASGILVMLLLKYFSECKLEYTGINLDDDRDFDYPHMHDPHDLYKTDHKDELPNEPYDNTKYYVDTLPDEIHEGAPSSLDDTIWNTFPSKEQPEEFKEEGVFSFHLITQHILFSPDIFMQQFYPIVCIVFG